MAVRRDRPGPPAGKDFDPEHYYNLWRYVTRFIRYSDLGQPLVAVGGATGTSTTGTLTLAVASSSGGGGFGTIAGAGDLNGTSTTGTLTSFLSTLAGTFFQVGAVPNLLNFNGTDANGFQMQLWGSHTNGVNFLMRGTGATPRKYFRVVGAGVLEVVNNAYSQTLFSINDAGTTTAVAFGAGFSQWGTTSAGFVSGGTGTFASINAGNLGTMARFSSYVAAGDALGTSTTGTLTLALSTTGVSTGTVGGIQGIPYFDLSNSGRVLSAGVTSTLASALQIGTATADAGELLTVRGALRLGRQNTSGEGGQINFERASDAAVHWSLDLIGTGSGGSVVGVRFVDNVLGIAPVIVYNNLLKVGSNISIGGTGTAASWFVQGTATANALAAASVVAGGVGTPLNSVLLVTGNTPSAAASFSIRNLAVIPSSVTAAAYGNISQLGVAGTSTLGALIHYNASPVAFGTLAGVGVQYGFIAESNLTEGTTNYGFFSNIGTGATTRFNFFANGGAPNAFAGNSRFGGLTTPTVPVDVTGDVRATGTTTAAAAQFGTASGQFARWGTSSQTLMQGAAAGVTGTGTFGGVLSTRALSGAVGSSGSRSNAVIGPYVNGVPVSITTVAGTLMGYGLPANAITGSGQGVEFSMWGTAQLSPANGGLIVKLGTATLINGTSTIAPSAWVVEGQVVGQGSAQQQFFTRFAVFTNNGVGIEQINVGTLGMNLSTVTTLHLAGTGTNSNARQQNGMTVKFMGLQ